MLHFSLSLINMKVHLLFFKFSRFSLIHKEKNFQIIKGIYLSKALTCMKFFMYKQKLLFIKETDTFGHIVVSTIYTSHIDQFTPKHTAFEQSTACLPFFLELLPGLIPFAIL